MFVPYLLILADGCCTHCRVLHNGTVRHGDLEDGCSGKIFAVQARCQFHSPGVLHLVILNSESVGFQSLGPGTGDTRMHAPKNRNSPGNLLEPFAVGLQSWANILSFPVQLLLLGLLGDFARDQAYHATAHWIG